MGSYYYVKDKSSDFGYTPVPEEEYTQAIISIAKKKGIEITDEMILKELDSRLRGNDTENLASQGQTLQALI